MNPLWSVSFNLCDWVMTTVLAQEDRETLVRWSERNASQTFPVCLENQVVRLPQYYHQDARQCFPLKTGFEFPFAMNRSGAQSASRTGSPPLLSNQVRFMERAKSEFRPLDTAPSKEPRANSISE